MNFQEVITEEKRDVTPLNMLKFLLLFYCLCSCRLTKKLRNLSSALPSKKCLVNGEICDVHFFETLSLGTVECMNI